MASSPEDRTALDDSDAIDDPTLLRSIEEVLADPATSYWLKAAIQSLANRDPVDALNDALVLAALLEERLRIVLDLDGHHSEDGDEER